MSDHCNFVATDHKQLINELAAPLFARHFETSELHACGTATIIGRGYAITAAHVIEDYLHVFGQELRQGENNQSTFDLLLYLTLNNGEEMLPLKVLKLWLGNTTDIAVLWLGIPTDWPDEEHIWKAPRIQLLPPKEGEFISGFGFADPVITQVDGEIPAIDINPRTTTGKVVEVHRQRRDHSRLNFPCFRVDARFDGSMSGGPVFGESGNLCGIVCSSLPADKKFHEHISYVAMLWPMLGFLIEHSSSSGETISSHPLSDYFDGGHFFAVDRDRVIVHHVPGQPPTVTANYSA